MVSEVSTTEEFSESIKDCKVVVDFHATWCNPCKEFAPKYEELAQAYPEVKFLKVNVNSLEDLAMDYNVEALPTFVLLNDGTEVSRQKGTKENELRSLLEELKHLPSGDNVQEEVGEPHDNSV